VASGAWELGVPGAWVFDAPVFPDDRGSFAAPYRADVFAAAVGHPLHVVQAAGSGRALYLAEGLGHAFLALADGTVTTYLCSRAYEPAAEHGVSPTDPALGLPWSRWCDPGELVLSGKDAAAPTLAAARDAGLLPTWEACTARREALLASARP
jgi:dTDP-4-dehydrorhamnose 3,5-epimerase-like enzyme